MVDPIYPAMIHLELKSEECRCDLFAHWLDSKTLQFFFGGSIGPAFFYAGAEPMQAAWECNIIGIVNTD